MRYVFVSTYIASYFIFSSLKKLVNAGSNPSTAKDFQNVINTPLLAGEHDTLILNMIVPLELHLMLGIKKIN